MSCQACACRDCFELVYSDPGTLCDECKEAGCEPGHECKAYEPEDPEWEQAARTGEAPPNVHYNPLPVPHSCDGYGPGYPCQTCYPDGN